MNTENSKQGAEYLDATEYEPRFYMLAERCALVVIEDIADRSGFADAWSSMDMPLRKEMIEEWTKAILTELNAAIATITAKDSQ